MPVLTFATNRRRIVLAAIALVVVAALILLLSANKGRSVPLAEIITTSPQGGMRYFDDIFSSADRERYQRQFSGSRTNPLSILLVEATNERSAISVSSRVLFGPVDAEMATRAVTTDTAEGDYWLVAYLGAGPSYPTWFVVTEVIVKSDKIRLTYNKAEPTMATRDLHNYYYWVPLGQLKTGVYHIELYGADLNKVTHSRRVEIRQEKRF